MDAGDRLTVAPQPVLDIAALRTRFTAQMAAVETAARDWGIRPEYPEGVFISTMIGTQAGFADLALSAADALHQIVADARAAAEEELARQGVITERTRQTLAKASGAIDRLDRNGHLAIQQIEVEKAQTLSQLVKDILPEMTRGVREALVIRERRYNHEREWRRALGIGGIMLGLVLAGYVWGTWSDWGMAGRVEAIGKAIERCQLTSHWADDKGNRLCEIRDFSAI